MYYIKYEDGSAIYVEDTDILQYAGQLLFNDESKSFPDDGIVINDSNLLDYDVFEDTDDWDKVNAYRKGMGCTIEEAFEQWNEAYVGEFDSEKAFSQSLHEDIVKHLPTHIQYNIDWQGVWDTTDRHSFFESDGYFFMNL